MELSFHFAVTRSCKNKYLGDFLFFPFRESEAPNSNAHHDQAINECRAGCKVSVSHGVGREA